MRQETPPVSVARRDVRSRIPVPAFQIPAVLDDPAAVRPSPRRGRTDIAPAPGAPGSARDRAQLGGRRPPSVRRGWMGRPQRLEAVMGVVERGPDRRARVLDGDSSTASFWAVARSARPRAAETSDCSRLRNSVSASFPASRAHRREAVQYGFQGVAQDKRPHALLQERPLVDLHRNRSGSGTRPSSHTSGCVQPPFCNSAILSRDMSAPRVQRLAGPIRHSCSTSRVPSIWAFPESNAPSRQIQRTETPAWRPGSPSEYLRSGRGDAGGRTARATVRPGPAASGGRSAGQYGVCRPGAAASGPACHSSSSRKRPAAAASQGRRGRPARR